MNRFVLAVLMIAFGITLLLDYTQLIPVSFYREYISLFARFWPVLLIMLGVRFFIKARYQVLAQILLIIVLFAIGLWLLCWYAGERFWVI